MLRFLTAGESHGSELSAILDGMPAGLPLSESDINRYLERRQGGYGRGARMKLEKDEVKISGGLWKGKTTGAPISLVVLNKGAVPQDKAPVRTKPRPGHADFAGAVKYGFYDDFNPVIERASARETTIRVAVGAVALKLLREFDIDVLGHVVGLGGVRVQTPADLTPEKLRRRRDESPFYCLSEKADADFTARVDEARAKGDTLGGIAEVLAFNVPPGLGTYAQFDRRLDARLAMQLLSIQACKAMEIGDGVEVSMSLGSLSQDPLVLTETGIGRSKNKAGGIEGGVTNGQTVVVRAYFKPISTLKNTLPTVDLKSGEAGPAPYIRSDVAVVPAASVIVESLVGFILADAFLERFGGDTVDGIRRAYDDWKKEFKKRLPFKK